MAQKQVLGQRQRQEQRMVTIRLSELLELPEREYRKWAGLLESDPLYRLLARPPEGLRRVVRRKPWPQSRFGPIRWEGQVEAAAPAAPLEEVPAQTLAIIQKVGRENFEKYFLYEEGETSLEEAAGLCGLTLAQAQAVADYLIAAQSPAGLAAPAAAAAAVDEIVAAVERGPQGLELAFLTPHYARGRYEIDYDGLKPLKASGLVERKEWPRLRELLGRLERANAKQTVLAGLLQLALKDQAAYLESGDPVRLAPLTQKLAAARLAAAPSTVSRALAGRSLRLPSGEIKPLAALFPSPRKIAVEFVRAVLRREPGLADRELQRRLETERHIRVTARSVNGYRRERA